MASVHEHHSSPYWQANFAAFDVRRGWIRRVRSTLIPLNEPKAKAQLVAERFEAAAKEVCLAARAQTELPRAYFEGVLRELEVLAAKPGGAAGAWGTGIGWKAWSKIWLDEQRGAEHSQTGRIAALNLFREYVKEDDFPLSKLTPERMQGFYDWLCVQGMTPGTVNVRWCSVKRCIKRAQLLGHIRNDPCGPVVTRGRVEPDGFHREAFTAAEVQAIFSRVEGEWLTACLFGYAYGLRLGDATQRRWSEIRDGVLTFVPEKKKGRPLKLPLIPMVRRHLEELAAGRAPGEWITPELAEANRSNLSRRFGVILERTGVAGEVRRGRGRGKDRKNKSFHSWRHTNKTFLRRAGVSDRVSNLITDHESEEVARRYDHVDVEECREALAKLPEIRALVAGMNTASADSWLVTMSAK